ncbi:MAG: Crp/Fnr family transcriptional regulator [Candidatus Eremiobacteraeota bacterium]|nr:Crp/Fnr family transcriptional regulator [Candidatus Eremiobacteraeota bacterium]MBC5802845.1 Crp/Fnr family transcriptional regulator [Candidatus Eremiobacteraeota bacterium]MBC5820795.1 Crp/Fnr family transcriptional regulator [Candidatus Eremiobacteraeota bacterium]
MAKAGGESFEQGCFGSAVSSELLPNLQENDFFYGVSRSVVDDSAEAFRMANLPDATILYNRKSVSTRVFLILRGAVQIGYPTIGRKRAVATLRSGRFTGEVSLMPGGEPLHQVTATCVAPTLLCWAKAADITALVSGTPQIALNVAQSLHARVADALTAIDDFDVA